MEQVSSEVFESLKQLDTPTVFNARVLHDGGPNFDYTDHTIRSMLPEMGVVLGYALTAEVTTNDADSPLLSWWEYHELIESSQQPAVVIMKDVDSQPGRGASFGDGMAAVHKRMGVAGAIVDGTIRDLPGIREVGFPIFAWGSVPGHGLFGATRLSMPLTVGQLRVRPGDLIMADVNGCIRIPIDDAAAILERTREVQETEGGNRDFVLSDEFTLERFGQRRGWPR